MFSPASVQKAATATSQSPPGSVPETLFAPPKLLLIFDHRSLFDVTDADYLEIEAWQEALASFGMAELSRKAFLQSISQKSEPEVMMQLCPFTTRMEWPSILNKKRKRMTDELKDWCFANAVAIPGVASFIEACTKEIEGDYRLHDGSEKKSSGSGTSDCSAAVPSSSSSSAATSSSSVVPTDKDIMKEHESGCLALWLTHWTLEHAHSVLDLAHLKSHTAASTYSSSSSDFAFIDVLEMFGMRPPVETLEAVAALAKHRNLPLEQVMASRQRLVKAFSSTVNEKAAAAASSVPPPPRVVIFTGSARVARVATRSGLMVVGVSYNAFDQEEDERLLLDGCDDEPTLLAAGCRIVIPNFSRMAPQYLRLL